MVTVGMEGAQHGATPAPPERRQIKVASEELLRFNPRGEGD